MVAVLSSARGSARSTAAGATGCREALRRLTESLAVGGYWTRSNDVEVDLIGAERDAVADHIDFVGSIKWHDERGFDNHDLVDLLRGATACPAPIPRRP